MSWQAAAHSWEQTPLDAGSKPTASGAPRCAEPVLLSRWPSARAARGNQSPKPSEMPSPTPSSLTRACGALLDPCLRRLLSPLALLTTGGAATGLFIPALGSAFTDERCERGSCCIFSARMPTQPPELPAGSVIVGINTLCAEVTSLQGPSQTLTPG